MTPSCEIDPIGRRVTLPYFRYTRTFSADPIEQRLFTRVFFWPRSHATYLNHGATIFRPLSFQCAAALPRPPPWFVPRKIERTKGITKVKLNQTGDILLPSLSIRSRNSHSDASL